MFKPEKILIFVIALASFLIGLVMVATVFDLGLVGDIGLSIGRPKDVSDSFQQTDDAVIENLQDGWQRFRSEGYAFQIDFPQQVSKKSVLNQEALNAGLGVSPETPVWEFKLKDPDYYQGTNLLEASLLIHVLRGEEEVEKCSQFKSRSKAIIGLDDPESPPVVEINGVPFWKDVVEEGVMGEIYKRISYRTVAQVACYELTQLIHTRNMGLYEPGTVEPYDREAVIEQLDSVLHTFRFLDVQPSFPKVVYPKPKAFRKPVNKGKDDLVDGLDVSHWQGDIDWPKVVDAGYVFTFVKATEGTGWTDPKFLENIREGAEAGEMMGVYHFARPDYGYSAKDEAEHFLNVVGDYLKSGYLRPVLDIEVGDDFSKHELTAWVMEWMETVEKRAGVEPLIYTGLWRANTYFTEEVTKYDLWIAYWSCEPEPTFDMPPTGKWADWSFWQYYGPGGCGKNAGYVPGIEKNIDLNIFNGVESGLLEYDAASPLWVSLVSDTYYAPKPYDAEITADVNGDTTGPVNYHFWWDCTALESDVAAVEGACGELPTPDAGECLGNENGMRCVGIDSEIQIAGHTYPEVGDYTSKVIVERGKAQTAEDRYKVTVYNPVRSIRLEPTSPGVGPISEPFRLKVVPIIRTSIAGTLQVEVHDEESGEVIHQACKPVEGDFKGAKTFNFYVSEAEIGVKEYRVWARYRPDGECSIEDIDPDDISKSYLIEWQEPSPTIALERPIGTVLPQDSEDEVGERAVHRDIELTYQVYNPSPSTSIHIQDIFTENMVNVDDLTIDTGSPIEVLPEGKAAIRVSFQIGNAGPFAFDLALEHDADNPSPYRITVQGNGVEVPDVLQTLDVTPASPGSAWIGKSFALSAEVGLETTTAGVLQIHVVDQSSGKTADQICRSISSGVQGTKNYDLSWKESAAGEKDYTVWARYRAGGSCPVSGTQDGDLSAPYQVQWREDPPGLELQRPEGTSQPAGSVDRIGAFDFYQSVELGYVIHNPSRTNRLKITEITAGNINNLSGVDVSPDRPFELASGAKKTVTVSFLVDNSGPFSFDMKLTHDGSNPSPYVVTVEGKGVMDADPIQSLDLNPASPGKPLIGDTFSLSVEVSVDIPVAGALQVSVVDQATGKIRDKSCQNAAEGLTATKQFDLSWTESAPGEREYKVRALYQAGSGCPLEGSADAGSSVNYRILWEEDTPILGVQRPQGTARPSGSVDQIGEYEFYQPLNLTYFLHNPSTTSSMRVEKVYAENLNHLSNVDISRSGPFDLGAGERKKVTVSFRVEHTDPFSFDLSLEHDASNSSPYQVSVQGNSVLEGNPIQSLTPKPASPGYAWVRERFTLQVEVVVEAPADSALLVSLIEKESGEVRTGQCMVIEGKGRATGTVELPWTETSPGEKKYVIQARYQVGGECPPGEGQDATLTENYQITWQEEPPVLDVKRPEGVTIVDGTMDYIGQHDWFDFVEVTYVLENESRTTPMEVKDIYAENLSNLKRVKVTPSGPFRLGPGEERTVKVLFLVLTVDPYAFDLVFEHNGPNGGPYEFAVHGEANLNVEKYTTDPRAQMYIKRLVDQSFFLQIPDFVLNILEGYME